MVRLLVLTGELGAAAGIAFLADLLVPAVPSLLLSGIAAGLTVVFALRRTGVAVSPNRTVREVGLAVAGLCIGASIPVGALLGAGTDLVLYTGLSMLTMLAGCALSLLFAKATGTDRCTALLVMFPGALGAVTSIAEEKSRHASVVVAVQTLRIAAVLVFVSVLAGLSTPAGSSSAVASPGAFAVFAAVLVPTWLVWWALRRISSPLPGFFAGLLVGFACYALRHAAPPGVIATLGQVLLGIAAGESIAAGLRLRSRIVCCGALGVLATVGIGAGAATVIHEVTGLDWLTAVLVTAPGSPSEITVFALALPVQIECVVLAQVVRQIMTNLALPPLVRLFCLLDRRTEKPVTWRSRAGSELSYLARRTERNAAR